MDTLANLGKGFDGVTIRARIHPHALQNNFQRYLTHGQVAYPPLLKAPIDHVSTLLRLGTEGHLHALHAW